MKLPNNLRGVKHPLNFFMKGAHINMESIREYFYEYGIECCACIACATLGYFAGKKSSNKKEEK